MNHSHNHQHISPESDDWRVSLAIWANAVLTIGQVLGGILSGSLALIADALHNFSDMASLVIAFAARKISRRPADARMTFGYGRIEIVAALINYTTLVIVGGYLVYEGIVRIIDPPAVGGWIVVILGSLALLIDTLTALLTYSMQKDSLNIRALFLHNLSDALASLAVVLGGALILLYDWRLVDPLVTIGIAGYILYLSLTEISRPIQILMLGAPDGIDAETVLIAIEDIDGVAEIHHVHFWQMQERQSALDAHIVLDRDALERPETVKAAVKKTLADRFGISHSTLEFEHPDHIHEGAARLGHEAHSSPLPAGNEH